MRIHLQSYPGSANFPLTQAVWDEAAPRWTDVSSGHELSFGDTREALEAGMRDAEVLIAQASSLIPGLPPSPDLKLIYVTSAGLEKLAPFAWLPEGVPLLNNRGAHGAKAGEFGLMALLMLVNWIPFLATAQREGRWAQKHGSVLAGHRALVIGLGTLGGSIAQHARDFGMRVTGVRTRNEPHPACERVVGVSELETVLSEAQFVVLAAPLTPATRGLLSRERIGMLPEGAGVVNVGRGPLADQEALLDALDSGHLGGAVLDVFEQEPIPPGHRLWTTRNLIITPHTSADDPNTYNARSMDIFFENLRAFREGKVLPNRFDPARGY